MKYRCVLRREPSEDAAACLMTCFEQLGAAEQYDRVVHALHTNEDDDALSAAAAVCSGMGYSTSLFGASDEISPNDLSLPAVLELSDGEKGSRLVVLHRLGRRRAVIADPEEGLMRVELRALAVGMTGRVLALGDTRPSVDGMVPRVSEIITAAVCTLVTAGCAVGAAFVAGELLGSLAELREENSMLAAGTALLLLCAFGCCTAVLLRSTGCGIAERLSALLLRTGVSDMLDVPEKTEDPEAVMRTIRSVEAPQRLYLGLLALPVGLLCAVGGVVSLFFVAPGAAVCCLVALAICAAAVLSAVRHAYSQAEEDSRLRAALDGMLSVRRDCLRGRLVPGARGEMTERTAELCLPYSRCTADERGTAMFRVVPAVAAVMAGAVCLWLCAASLAAGAADVGDTVRALLLCACVLVPIALLTGRVEGTLVAYRYCRDCCAVTYSAAESDESSPKTSPEDEAVLLRAVEYGAGGRTLLLDRVSLCVEQGEKVAVTGTPQQQTALVRLLTGTAIPQRGSARLFGSEASSLSRSELLARMTVLSAVPYLPESRSVAEALRMSAPGGRMDEDAARLCRRLELDECIETMPLRYETRCSALSGEQRVLLAAACALLSGRQLIILDRSLDCLDTAAARRVLDAIQAATVVLTGREELCALCDRSVALPPVAEEPEGGAQDE